MRVFALEPAKLVDLSFKCADVYCYIYTGLASKQHFFEQPGKPAKSDFIVLHQSPECCVFSSFCVVLGGTCLSAPTSPAGRSGQPRLRRARTCAGAVKSRRRQRWLVLTSERASHWGHGWAWTEARSGRGHEAMHIRTAIGTVTHSGAPQSQIGGGIQLC